MPRLTHCACGHWHRAIVCPICKRETEEYKLVKEKA